MEAVHYGGKVHPVSQAQVLLPSGAALSACF
jgi:hypothetical protein